MPALSRLRAALLLAACWLPLVAQQPGTPAPPVHPEDPASRAYAALSRQELHEAATAFQEAITLQPAHAPLRKDYAYALLRMGETEAAREQFAEVMRLTPEDSAAALEYAFLCHETGQPALAWAIFRKLQDTTNAEHRATARRTFAQLDAALQSQIDRLQQALAAHPEDDSTHMELARAYAVRNQDSKAASHFEAAFRLKPDIPERLLDLAAAAHRAGDSEKARAALLAASRSSSAFVAEQARGLQPDRYPYLYEFQNALALAPSQPQLHRELAFFLVALGRTEEAMAAFRSLLTMAPDDCIANAQLGFLLQDAGEPRAAAPFLRAALATDDPGLLARVTDALSNQSPATHAPATAQESKLRTVPAEAPAPEPYPSQSSAPASDPPAPATSPMQAQASGQRTPVAVTVDSPSTLDRAQEAREMGRKSYEQGFLPDAVRYYREAQELDPTNFDTILRLAYSLNMAQRDQEAVQWFFLAARSPEPAIAAEATKALRNLTAPAPSGAAQAQAASPRTGLVASLWAMPMHSTRWGSTFAFSQAKTELELPRLPVVPYLSLRFVGDTTGAVGQANPQFLSENAFILGGGLRTRPKRGVLLWAEAGSAMAYLGSQRQATAQFAPDYRGGISQFQIAGRSLLATSPGWFAETMNDLVYIHRFDRNTLAISRNRIGHHFGKRDSLGGLQFQLFLNLNANTDFKRQAWANFVEAGPGIRFRWSWMPPSVSFTFSALRGHHPIARTDNRPNTYTDFQAGLWYAVTH